jgi:hypothetical protein
VALLAGAVPSLAQDPPVAEPTQDVGPMPVGGSEPVANNHEMRQKYIYSTLGLEGALSATFGSGLDQWQGKPPEWSMDATGYAQRWISDYAESAIGQTTKYVVARIFHHDPSFTRCECSGFGRRLLHAVDSPDMARRRNGTRTLSAASLAGVLAGNVVSSSTWYPAPLGARDGLQHAASSLLTKVLVDVFQEFRPHRSKEAGGGGS